MKPILAITMGDPAGIGPEIIIKALSLKETYEKCNPIVTGDAAVMEFAARQAGSELSINAVTDVKDAKFRYGTIDVYDLNCIDMQAFKQGEVAAQCGDAAFKSVVKAIEEQLKRLPRLEITEKALAHSRIIVLKNTQEVIDFTNYYAPEHLIIQTRDYGEIAEKIQNAGSVFMGPYTITVKSPKRSRMPEVYLWDLIRRKVQAIMLQVRIIRCRLMDMPMLIVALIWIALSRR